MNSKYLLGILTLLTHIFVWFLFVNNQDLLLLFSPVCTFYYYGYTLMAICICSFLLCTCFNNNNIYLKSNIQCTYRYEFSGLMDLLWYY